eukprot:UN24957
MPILLIVLVHTTFPWFRTATSQNLDVVPALLELVYDPSLLFSTWTMPELHHFICILGFIMYEAFLMVFLPTPDCRCLPTPAGNIVKFRVNALPAWFLTVGAYFGVQWIGLMPKNYVHEEFWDLLTVLLIVGDIFTFLFYFKGIYYPTNSDATFRGRFWQDIYLGIELHPKIGTINCKLFAIGRIGMNLWTLVNLAHLQNEYYTRGYVTWPMILVNFFAAVYTVDWAYKEQWYIRTIDMCHDRFGFMLITGPLTFIPTFFCCQTLYLSYRPRDISTPFAIGAAVFFIVSYVGFRICNDQKDYVRQTKGQSKIWGYRPTVIKATYKTSDGKEHKSLLLASHLWGGSRHFNYFVDWCMSVCYGVVVGFDGLMPHLYFIYMVCLLTHRAYRDDRKCRNKYQKFGKDI